MDHLIPDSFFLGMTNWMLACLFLISLAALVKGADWLVQGAANLAYRLGIGKIIVGATIVSIGTTTPECAVSVMAAWDGEPGLALGNAVGSIICDTALVFGLCATLALIPKDRFILNRHGWLQFGSGVLLALICGVAWLMSDGGEPTIPRLVGVFFLVLLAGYLWISIRWARGHTMDQEMPKEERGSSAAVHSFWIVFGLLVVLFSCRLVIGSLMVLATRWEVPKEIIAATLVAFGTSLPELVTGITAVRRKHPELLVGNVIGADILNVLFVIGGAATVTPLAVPSIFYVIHIPVMLFVLLLFRIFIAQKGNHFKKWMGWPLLLTYVAYVIIQYLV